MRIKNLLFTAAACLFIYVVSVTGISCAQIGAPTGGPRDTIAPILINAQPAMRTTNFTGKQIVFTFDEYINVLDVQKNVLVSPLPKVSPIINFKLKTVTVNLKDTLLANTTYVINFGNAIVDNNEGNIFKEFKYVFSTGKIIDSLKLSGTVLLAETGKADSTIIALLYLNANDSSVLQKKPNYIAKLNAVGHFEFTNLAAGKYSLYALRDANGTKMYNNKVLGFAFLDNVININGPTDSVTLYAYEQEKEKKKASSVVASPSSAADKKFKFTSSVSSSSPQGLLNDSLQLHFNNTLKKFDTNQIILTDTNYNKIASSTIILDSSRKIVSIINKWPQDTYYRLIITKDAVSDSANGLITKTDTIRFKTKKISEYGSLTLRFSKIDLSKHPVIQFIKTSEIVKAVKVTGPIWSDKLFEPGEYELRILFDTNNNGVWDPGNYTKKLQPERAITLDKKLTIKADWDNERDIEL